MMAVVDPTRYTPLRSPRRQLHASDTANDVQVLSLLSESVNVCELVGHYSSSDG